MSKPNGFISATDMIQEVPNSLEAIKKEFEPNSSIDVIALLKDWGVKFETDFNGTGDITITIKLNK